MTAMHVATLQEQAKKLNGRPLPGVRMTEAQFEKWRDEDVRAEWISAGVREYWIIDPSSKRVEAYTLGRTRNYKQIEEKEEKIFSKVLSGFYIRPEWLWKSPLPRVAGVLKELRVR